MKHFLHKNKWPILWSALGVSTVAIVAVAIIFSDKTWSNLLIQFGIMLVTVGSAILIMLSNNEKSDEGTKMQLDSIQEATSKQINALQESTAKQNEHLTTLTNNHISAHKNEFEKQSNIIRDENQKQIENIQSSTQNQIAVMQNESSKQMEHLSNLTSKQIDANRLEYDKQNTIIREENKKQIENIQNETEKQIKALQEEFKKQMTHLTELTNKHIENNEKESAKQIRVIKEQAQKQVDGFIKQTQEITDRLEDVSENLTTLAKLNGQMVEMEKQMKQLEEDKLKRREVELKQKKFEIIENKERMRPAIAYRLEDDTEWLFWNYMFVHLNNYGGDASSINITISFKNEYTGKIKSQSAAFSNIRRGQTVKFKAARTKQVSDCNIIEIRISAWDTNHREYTAHLWWYRVDNSWLKVDMTEKRNLSLEMSGQS